MLNQSRWKPVERRIWLYALAAAPAWAFYCIVTGIVLFEKEDLERVPQRLAPLQSQPPEPSLSPQFGTTVIIPGDVDSMSRGFRDLLQPSQQTFSDAAAHLERQRASKERQQAERERQRAHLERQRAQDERIAEIQERNRQRQARNDSYVWNALSSAFGYPIAWLGALLTLFEVRARLNDKSTTNN